MLLFKKLQNLVYYILKTWLQYILKGTNIERNERAVTDVIALTLSILVGFGLFKASNHPTKPPCALLTLSVLIISLSFFLCCIFAALSSIRSQSLQGRNLLSSFVQAGETSVMTEALRCCHETRGARGKVGFKNRK